MKKFIALIMTALTCVALAVPAGATFTQYADKEYLCTSSAGYNFNIDDYYNYMKRYNGMTYTTTSYYDTFGCAIGVPVKYFNRSGMVFSGADWQAHQDGFGLIQTYKCQYDNAGNMKLSCNISYPFGSAWEGLTITSAGDISYTYTSLNYCEDAHYNSLTDTWTWYTYTPEGCDRWTETHLSHNLYDNNYHDCYITDMIGAFASESMRECYWHYVPYVCYWGNGRWGNS